MRHAGGEIHPHPHEPDHEHFHEREDGGEREGPEHGGYEAREPSFPRSAAFPTLHDVGRDVVQRRAVHRVLPRRRAHSRGILQQTGRAIHRGGDARLAVLGVETQERAPRLARVDLIVKPLRVLKQRGGAAVRRLVRHVPERLERARGRHPIRRSVHPRELRARAHPGEHHHPRRIVPRLDDPAHRPVPDDGERRPRGATAFQQVNALLSAPPPDVRHHRSIGMPRGEFVARRGDVLGRERVGGGDDGVHGERAVMPIAPPDASGLELALETRGGGDARVRESRGGSLEERGAGREEVDAVELRDVGVDGVDERRAGARAKHGDGDVAEEVGHHHGRDQRGAVQATPQLHHESDAGGVGESAGEVREVVAGDLSRLVGSVHGPELHRPALALELAGVLLPPRRDAAGAIDVRHGRKKKQEHALIRGGGTPAAAARGSHLLGCRH